MAAAGPATRFCQAGDEGVYQLAFTDAGELAFVVESDACEMRHLGSTVPQLFKPAA